MSSKEGLPVRNPCTRFRVRFSQVPIIYFLLFLNKFPFTDATVAHQHFSPENSSTITSQGTRRRITSSAQSKVAVIVSLKTTASVTCVKSTLFKRKSVKSAQGHSVTASAFASTNTKSTTASNARVAEVEC